MTFKIFHIHKSTYVFNIFKKILYFDISLRKVNKSFSSISYHKHTEHRSPQNSTQEKKRKSHGIITAVSGSSTKAFSLSGVETVSFFSIMSYIIMVPIIDRNVF